MATKPTKTTVTVEDSASITKLAGLTGAAKDDNVSASVTTGLGDLNVLANDPGSAVIYSLAQTVFDPVTKTTSYNGSTLAATAQFPVVTTGDIYSSGGAKLSLNSNGTIHYDASSMQPALQALAEGELFNDSFVYTIRMANGTLSTATAHVTITGVNDAPTLAAVSATTVNDTIVFDNPGVLVGQLAGHDVDHGAVLTYGLADGVDGKSAYGDLTVNADGSYSFAVNADALNALAAGENATASFNVVVTDEHGAKSGTQAITYNLIGANDAPTLAAVSATTVSDTAADDQPEPQTGNLAGHDVDHGAVLTYGLADGVDGKSAYGDLTVNNDGSYSFAVNAGALNALAAGENKTVSFDVVVKDEHGATATQTIQYNLVGANDTAEISGGATGAVTEDGTLAANGTLIVADRDHGQSAFAAVDANALHGTYGDFTFDQGVWTYALRNGDTNVQALISGQQVTDKLTVTSLDGSASQDIVVTINGADEAPLSNDKPPVDPNGAVTKFMVNQGTSFINNRATFTGFDGNDNVVYANNYNFNKDISTGDFNNDGTLDTLLSFTEPHGNQTTVEIVLLGYTGLTAAHVIPA